MPVIAWVIGGVVTVGGAVWAGYEWGDQESDQYYQEKFWDSIDWRTGIIIGLLGYWAFAKSTGKRVTVQKSKR